MPSRRPFPSKARPPSAESRPVPPSPPDSRRRQKARLPHLPLGPRSHPRRTRPTPVRAPFSLPFFRRSAPPCREALSPSPGPGGPPGPPRPPRAPGPAPPAPTRSHPRRFPSHLPPLPSGLPPAPPPPHFPVPPSFPPPAPLSQRVLGFPAPLPGRGLSPPPPPPELPPSAPVHRVCPT